MYKRLNSEQPPPSETARLLKRAALGLTAVGVLGWFWGRSSEQRNSSSTDKSS
jgi:hypothetical protein